MTSLKYGTMQYNTEGQPLYSVFSFKTVSGSAEPTAALHYVNHISVA